MAKATNTETAPETTPDPKQLKQLLRELFAEVETNHTQRDALLAAEGEIAEKIYTLCGNSNIWPRGKGKGTGYKATKRTDPDTKQVSYYLTELKPPKKKEISL